MNQQTRYVGKQRWDDKQRWDNTSEKKVLKLGSKEIDVINNSCIYDTYKDLYLIEKERREDKAYSRPMG